MTFLLYLLTTTLHNLNLHWYNSFTKSVTNIKPDIYSLPPTAGAAKQHSFCVYHQNRLVHTTIEDDVAPEAVLNLIFCRCTTGY
ncbi:hypothetical protein PR048_012686 [Dryococelus australis]|uniref:Secreted protein n=1 Tax=Dryococelus australis TaxID=614101 RepID=A0ABQ9HQB7_9NEOP|nr:hypothetical protein PR048_012686 [Dryococelus australis]